MNIQEFLKIHGWEKALDPLVNFGIDNVKDLVYLEESDLISLNIPKIICRGIMEEVNLLKIIKDNTDDFLNSVKSNHSDEKILFFAQNTTNPDVQDTVGNCSLHFLIARNRITVIEGLPANKFNPNIRNKKGETPLHWAARSLKSDQRVGALIKLEGTEKLNVGIKDENGISPLEIAGKLKNYDCIKQITEYKVTQLKGNIGNLDISLIWFDYNDLDLHVKIPNSKTIFYGDRSIDGGILDIDANNDNHVEDPIEHITFENQVPSGTFEVMVDYYSQKGGPIESPFQLLITIKQKAIVLYHGICKEGDQKKIACTFTWDSNSSYITNIKSTGYCEEDFNLINF